MWIDIVLAIVLIAFVAIGIWKGFFDSILGLISTAIAVVVGITCAKPATGFINKLVNLPGWFEKLLSKAFQEGEVIKLFGNENLAFDKTQLANFLAVVATGIILFFITKIGIWLIAKLFDSVVENSSIGSGLNKLLGGVFGLLRGGAVVITILLLCSFLSGVPIIGNTIQNTIDDTKVTHYVYKYVSDYTEKQLEKTDIKDFVVNMVESAQNK